MKKHNTASSSAAAKTKQQGETAPQIVIYATQVVMHGGRVSNVYAHAQRKGEAQRNQRS